MAATAITVLQGVNTVLSLLDSATVALGNAQKVSAMVAKAQADGKDTLDPAEWAALFTDDDNARAALVAAIEKAKAAGN